MDSITVSDSAKGSAKGKKYLGWLGLFVCLMFMTGLYVWHKGHTDPSFCADEGAWVDMALVHWEKCGFRPCQSLVHMPLFFEGLTPTIGKWGTHEGFIYWRFAVLCLWTLAWFGLFTRLTNLWAATTFTLGVLSLNLNYFLTTYFLFATLFILVAARIALFGRRYFGLAVSVLLMGTYARLEHFFIFLSSLILLFIFARRDLLRRAFFAQLTAGVLFFGYTLHRYEQSLSDFASAFIEKGAATSQWYLVDTLCSLGLYGKLSNGALCYQAPNHYEVVDQMIEENFGPEFKPSVVGPFPFSFMGQIKLSFVNPKIMGYHYSTTLGGMYDNFKYALGASLPLFTRKKDNKILLVWFALLAWLPSFLSLAIHPAKRRLRKTSNASAGFYCIVCAPLLCMPPLWLITRGQAHYMPLILPPTLVALWFLMERFGLLLQSVAQGGFLAKLRASKSKPLSDSV